jgi:aryl-alcohol dehydrogenase-like predicted oxidoreductase
MHYRQLGNSDLRVSEIALGSWLTHEGAGSRDRAARSIRAAFEAGVTLFDTANAYGRGRAETTWGEILPRYRRDSYLLATKVFFPMSEVDYGLSARQIEKQLDASLARLKTDYVDLYQCHRFDPDTPLEETLEALTAAVAAGKVRYLGFSEWTTEQILAAIEVPGVARFVSSQPQYSLLWRVPEAQIFATCRSNGIGNIVWSPLAEGILTGKYRPHQVPPPDSRAADPVMGAAPGTFVHRWLASEAPLAVSRLERIAREAGLTMVQLALGWVLRRDEVSAAIIGATRPDHVMENARASGVSLQSDVLAAVDAVLGDLPVRIAELAPGARRGVMHRRP